MKTNLFFQINLKDDGVCIRQTDDNTVPRIVYFVIFGKYEFRFLHYVSMMAAKRYVSPSAIYVIGDAHPLGYWWTRLMRDCRGVRFIYRSLLFLHLCFMCHCSVESSKMPFMRSGKPMCVQPHPSGVCLVSSLRWYLY